MEIAKGLQYIHGQGIIHRDLRADNIFISANNRIKIGDFGLSTQIKLIFKKYPKQRLKDSLLSDVPMIISPERNYNTPKLDMYDFGLIVFDMCHPPFKDDSERRNRLLEFIEKDVITPTELRAKYSDYFLVKKW